MDYYNGHYRAVVCSGRKSPAVRIKVVEGSAVIIAHEAMATRQTDNELYVSFLLVVIFLFWFLYYQNNNRGSSCCCITITLMLILYGIRGNDRSTAG